MLDNNTVYFLNIIWTYCTCMYYVYEINEYYYYYYYYGAIVLGVFLDFSKAFDTVDHQILLNTQFMEFSLMKHIITNTDLCINNQIIDRVEHTMFLGVIFDSHLTWSYHIQHVKIKIAKNIGILCRARKVLKRTTLITLYYAFIYPYLTYCVEDSYSD